MVDVDCWARLRAWAGALAVGLLAAPPLAHADEGPVLVDLHFKPVTGLQIAIWFEDPGGQFLNTVFVTQATGKLGIGNRSGHWMFLSSWRAPYGPRPQVLPIWAHRRDTAYPKIVFLDDHPGDQESLGWHEESSSVENYFCRPLMPEEHAVISTDTMTCPSPQEFATDKGRFDPDQISFYPPRNDLITFGPNDSPDAKQYAELNDLDSVTRATPAGDEPVRITAVIPWAVAEVGPLVAWIEVSLEHDENGTFSYERDDHLVDPRLDEYGVEYFGQPSVAYAVEIDPREAGFASTRDYAGYGEWDGTSGTIYPPAAIISEGGGSGADRLQLYTENDETFRFGVYSYGPDTGDTGGDTDDGWGGCRIRDLPAMVELELEPIAFDTVRIHFTIPTMDDMEVGSVEAFYRSGDVPLDDDNISSAYQATFTDPMVPGERTHTDLHQLFGNYTYQVGIRYHDTCGNQSGVVADEVTTPKQKFAQVEGACFVATAAYGAPWVQEVEALRRFRDDFLEPVAVGAGFIQFYYTYSPPLAKSISRIPLARDLTRIVLQPLADTARLVTGV